MSATPIVYASTDGSAPVLDGQNGSLITILRAILVAGYGAKAAAGWTEPYTAAANIASFKNDGTVGSGMYINVIDNGGTAATGKTAVIRGYSSMSALSVGTNPFPSVAQESVGLYVRKSETANSTARPWFAIACRKWIYLFIASNSEASNFQAPYVFGDVVSHQPGDGYNGLVSAGGTVDPGTSGARSSMFNTTAALTVTPAGATTRAYMAGAYTQVAAAIPVALFNAANIGTPGGTSAPCPYPNGAGNALLTGALAVVESPGQVRGRLPNCYASWHILALTDQTSLTDTPSTGLTGLSKKFSANAAGSFAGELLFDLTTTS